MEKTVNSRIDVVEKVVKEGHEFLKWMIGILAAVVVVGITLPPIWQERRERKASSFTQSVTAKLDSLTQNFARLEQEIAKLDSLTQSFARLEREIADLKKPEIPKYFPGNGTIDTRQRLSMR